MIVFYVLKKLNNYDSWKLKHDTHWDHKIPIKTNINVGNIEKIIFTNNRLRIYNY